MRLYIVLALVINLGIIQAQVNPALHVAKGRTVLFGADTSGNGIKVFWLPAKGAFRAGAVGNIHVDDSTYSTGDLTAWDFDSVGVFSFAAGYSSRATGPYSVAFGEKSTSSGIGSFATGSYTTAAGDYSVAMGKGFLEATGFGAVALGANTKASGNQSIAMGSGNEASGQVAIAMGLSTQAYGRASTAMGDLTQAIGSSSTAMGFGSTASGSSSTAMGNSTTASGIVSTAMGIWTTASGYVSTAMGCQTTASGDTSTAMGYGVSTNGQVGAFIIGDADPNREGETIGVNENEMVARFWNGYYFMTSGDNIRTGIRAPHGSNSWLSICDRNKKENFQSLNDDEVLQKLASVNYQSWNYKGQNPKTFRHYGIMAQEFHDLFGQDRYGSIGNDTLVNAIDMIGVAMRAIKGAKLRTDRLRKQHANLSTKVIGLQDLIEKQKSIVAQQQSRILTLEKEVEDIEQLKAEMAEFKLKLSQIEFAVDLKKTK